MTKYQLCEEGKKLRDQWVEDYNRVALEDGEGWRKMLYGKNAFTEHKRICPICSAVTVAQRVIEGTVEIKGPDEDWLDEPEGYDEESENE